jgi:hypothetical protein
MFLISAPAKQASLTGANDTIPYNFRRYHVSSACSELKRVIDQVASNSDAYAVGVFLLGTMINHNAGTDDFSIPWDVANVSVQMKKDGVIAFGDTSTSLRQVMEFFAHCFEPQISEQGIFNQLPVIGDGFFGDRVYYTIAVFFNFNNRTCVLIMGKFSRDRDGRGIRKSQVNNVT